MKWYCFLFWFVYRLVLACLAHFNWCVALYTNCAYFWIWKSYDLLWFWMHLTLCSCFPQLRRENYLIVWCNLIYKRCTQYPNLTYKQLYLALYGGQGTKAERALQRMDTIEKRERESRRLRRLSGASSSSSSEEGIPLESANTENVYKPIPIKDIIAEEEEECRKFVYVGQAVDSQVTLEQRTNDNTPIPPPRHNKTTNGSSSEEAAVEAATARPSVTFSVEVDGGDNGSGEDSDTNSTTHWVQRMPVPKMIRNKFRKSNASGQSQASTDGLMQGNEDTVSITTWGKIRGMIPNPLKFNRSASNSSNPNELDILKPDYSNTYDLKDAKLAEKRARKDKRLLTTKLRKRLREELKEAARIERKRRMVTDSIELLLQLLRMIASFAILIGNIRKTFIPAQFKYLKPGQHAYDNYELLLMFRVTTFMDVSMFWMNIMWVYCLQWHLCCRLGFLRFWAWAALLGFIASVVMLIPMSFVMDQMDLSWCRFMPNTTLEKYQPS